jgi:predicted protein tyrosine phosphatase
MQQRRLRVLFVSQGQAERMRPPRNCALISITDLSAPLAVLRPGWSSILRLAFDDVDPITFPGMNRDFRSLSGDQAEELAGYVVSQLPRCARIVVHCRHGISRSAGIAKAIAEATGATFPQGYAEYNRHVYKTTLSALARAIHAA